MSDTREVVYTSRVRIEGGSHPAGLPAGREGARDFRRPFRNRQALQSFTGCVSSSCHDAGLRCRRGRRLTHGDIRRRAGSAPHRYKRRETQLRGHRRDRARRQCPGLAAYPRTLYITSCTQAKTSGRQSNGCTECIRNAARLHALRREPSTFKRLLSLSADA